jgi:hypothetical protein
MAKTTTDFDYEFKNTWLLKITCIYWLIVKAISWRIWTTNRLFPTAPVLESFDQIPPAIHLILFLLSLLFIGLLFVYNKNKIILVSLLIVEISSCLLDQNRWQPWEYQCIFIIFIFLINSNKQSLIIISFAFILASTYFYSGCNKLNESFLQNVWTYMLLKSFLKVPQGIAEMRWLHYSGYLLALFEFACGIGLLFPKTQKTAARALILMHLLILLFLGPFGLNYNKVIWPWNVVMILYLYIIFFKSNANALSFMPIFRGWNKLVLICWGILPAFSFVGYWDSYLSSSIYSGKSPQMFICIRDTSKSRQLQIFYKKNSSKICNGQAIINLRNWGMSETNIIPYPEIRICKIMQKKLEKQYAEAGLSCFIFIGKIPVTEK